MSATIETGPINYEALEQVKAEIQRESPELFVMESYRIETGCGTAVCIAGRGLLSIGGWTEEQLKRANGSRVFDAAAKLFGLNQGQAFRLFLLPLWPNLMEYDYRHATDAAEARDIAVKRLEHFIATAGQQ